MAFLVYSSMNKKQLVTPRVIVSSVAAPLAPQAGASAAAVDVDAVAAAYAHKLKAEALGRIMAYEDLAKHAELMGRVAESLDPNAATPGTPSSQTPAP